MNERYGDAQEAKAQYAGAAMPGNSIMSVKDELTMTPRENIKRRISGLRGEIKRLEISEQEMEKTGLLDLPIHMLRQVMQF